MQTPDFVQTINKISKEVDLIQAGVTSYSEEIPKLKKESDDIKANADERAALLEAINFNQEIQLIKSSIDSLLLKIKNTGIII